MAVIHHALDRGITLFNTSDLYGPYSGETVLGGQRGAAAGCGEAPIAGRSTASAQLALGYSCQQHGERNRRAAAQAACRCRCPEHAAAGKALAGRRGGVVIATKWGPMFKDGQLQAAGLAGWGAVVLCCLAGVPFHSSCCLCAM